MDYYLDDGFVVFTKEYHIKRGYCCKNNCKHCPYVKPENKKDYLIIDDKVCLPSINETNEKSH
jgi:2-iminoacetate synthase ThiH